MRARYTAVVAVLGGVMLGLAVPAPVHAVCPASVCDCIGEAKNFDVISSDKLIVSFGKISASGSSYLVETNVEGAVCGVMDTLVGSADEAPTSVGDAVALAPLGQVAVKVKGVKVSGVLDPGVEVTGDLVTGGGTIVNGTLAIVDGVVDTTGSHPLVGSCNQAVSDPLLKLEVSSTTLGSLTPDQSLGTIVAKGGDYSTYTITTHSGVNVIHADAIKISPQSVSGDLVGSELTIDMDADASLVVINTAKLSIGKQCLLTLSGPGADPDNVVINVTSASGVKVSQEASVEPIILAPLSTVTVLANAESSNVYGKKVTIKGAQVSGALACSPSGAFLNADETLF